MRPLKRVLRPRSRSRDVIKFALAVLHGDDEHKAWLLEAARAFVDRKPLPPPRDNNGVTHQNDKENFR